MDGYIGGYIPPVIWENFMGNLTHPHLICPSLGRPDGVVLRQRLRLKDLENPKKGSGKETKGCKDSQSTMYIYIYNCNIYIIYSTVYINIQLVNMYKNTIIIYVVYI